jgi:hypothetical protein
MSIMVKKLFYSTLKIMKTLKKKIKKKKILFLIMTMISISPNCQFFRRWLISLINFLIIKSHTYIYSHITYTLHYTYWHECSSYRYGHKKGSMLAHFTPASENWNKYIIYYMDLIMGWWSITCSCVPRKFNF